MARSVALVANWWNLFVRLADPEHHREAITSRPLLLTVIGRANPARRAYHPPRQQPAWATRLGATGVRPHRRLLRRVASNRRAVDTTGSMVSDPQRGTDEVPPRTPTCATTANSDHRGHSHGLTNTRIDRRRLKPTAGFRMMPSSFSIATRSSVKKGREKTDMGSTFRRRQYDRSP